MTILPDTSVWVDFLRRSQSPLKTALAQGSDISYTEPVLMELLSGTRDDVAWDRVRRLVTGATLLPFDSVADFEAAAWIRRYCGQRRVESTAMDSLIVAVAQRSGATLMTRDRQQAQVASLVGVEVLTA